MTQTPHTRSRQGVAIVVSALVLLVLVVAGVFLVVGGRDDVERQAGSDRSNEQRSESTEEEDSASETSAAAVPTSLSAGELLTQATDRWTEIGATLPGDATKTEVVSAFGIPTAAVVAESGAPLEVWEYSVENGWAAAVTLPIAWSSELPTPNELRFVDVSADGEPDLFISYFGGNDLVGKIYESLPGGEWRVVLEADRLEVGADGVPISYVETCVPDCASGPTVETHYAWDGSTFDPQTYDGFGNQVDIFISTGCVGDYNPREYAPLRRCDKGVAVEQLQAALAYYGFLISTDSEPPAVDGYFGKDTDTSVRIYQLYIGVPVTGIAEGGWYYDLIEAYNSSMGLT